LNWDQVADRVSTAVDRGLLQEYEGQYIHTETGWRFVNDIQAIFLPAHVQEPVR
jgi:hypothetical protein